MCEVTEERRKELTEQAREIDKQMVRCDSWP
jgi:hypothetical protein